MFFVRIVWLIIALLCTYYTLSGLADSSGGQGYLHLFIFVVTGFFYWLAFASFKPDPWLEESKQWDHDRAEEEKHRYDG
ncbi:MAG: hypothetical protein ACYC3P_05710 [Bellilinea sp.]